VGSNPTATANDVNSTEYTNSSTDTRIRPRSLTAAIAGWTPESPGLCLTAEVESRGHDLVGRLLRRWHDLPEPASARARELIMASVAEQAEEVAACLERTAEHHGIAVVDRSITDGDAGAIPGRIPGSEASSASRGIVALSSLRMCPLVRNARQSVAYLLVNALLTRRCGTREHNSRRVHDVHWR
jgi:hypothetical protein